MIQLFDYFFYRIFIFFKNRDDKVANTSALSILSLVEFCTLLDFMIIAQAVFEFPNPSKVYAFAAMLILLALNLSRYQSMKTVEKICEQWADENKDTAMRKGWLILAYLIISVFAGVGYQLL